MNLLRSYGFTYEGEKRQHLPCYIEWECPKCGYCCEVDYSESDYLSHPTMGGDNSVTLECQNYDEGCYEKIEIVLRIKIKVELVL